MGAHVSRLAAAVSGALPTPSHKLALRVVGVAGGGVGGALLAVWLLVRWVQGSVGLAPPTAAQLAGEDHAAHALFRHFPQLRARLAWRRLGVRRTPIHRGVVTAAGAVPTAADGSGGDGSGSNGHVVEFLVKREDLSSPVYGGNKVRGLQHQIAIAEARGAPTVIVLGSGGSNQVVATTAHMHAAAPGLRGRVSALWIGKDKVDLDNSLNMLSTLSFPLASSGNWGSPRALLGMLLRGWWRGGVVVPPGGNNTAGVLGNASAALELADQIVAGECADVDEIVLPVGSSCTISGLALGVALVRHLGLPAFRRPGFRITGVVIHDGLARLRRRAAALRVDRLAALARQVPFTIAHSVEQASVALRGLGGPDVVAVVRTVVRDCVKVVSDPRVVGVYGGHSAASLAASRAYDATGRVCDAEGREAPPLWLCGHFTAKAFAVLIEDALARPQQHGGAEPGDGGGEPPRVLFWQTKSAVQPRSEANDEFAAMQQMPTAVRKWAARGVAHSSLRQGAVDLDNGTHAGYRHLMTVVPSASSPSRRTAGDTEGEGDEQTNDTTTAPLLGVDTHPTGDAHL